MLRAQADGGDGVDDDVLLQRSTELGRVFVTQDIRFKALAEQWQREGIEFSGLIFAHQNRIGIGGFVRDLELIAKASDPLEWMNRVDEIPY